MSDGMELFENSPYLLDLIEVRMLKSLKNPVEKFLFVFIFMTGHSSVQAADALQVHPTNISRHLKKMRVKLLWYTRDYQSLDVKK